MWYGVKRLMWINRFVRVFFFCLLIFVFFIDVCFSGCTCIIRKKDGFKGSGKIGGIIEVRSLFKISSF